MHDLELDVLADEAAQQVRELRQHVGDAEDAGLQGLLAREGQELAHQVRGAVGVLLDLHDVGEGRVARPEAQQQQVAEADHRRQQVVEVVRHAAGELAHRLHLLGLGELGLQVLLLRRVDEVQDEAGLVVLLPVEAAQVDVGGALARALEADADRPRVGGALGGDGEAPGHVAGVGLGEELHQLAPEEARRRHAEELAQRPVRLLEAAVAVEERDAGGGVGEEALEALARLAQRLFPLVLAGEIAHHRPGAQAVLGLHHGLTDGGADQAALAAAEGHLAALGVVARRDEGRVLRAALGNLAGEEIREPGAALHQLAGRDAEPIRQRLVGIEEASLAVDGIEAAGRVVEEVRELHLLVADHLLHLVAGGDVLEAPEAVAGPARERMDREVEPRRHARQRAQHDPAVGAAVAEGLVAQAVKFLRRLAAEADPPLDGVERLGGAVAEQSQEGGVGVGDGAVRGQDQMGVGRGLQRQPQEIDAAGEDPMDAAGDIGGDGHQYRHRAQEDRHRPGDGARQQLAQGQDPDAHRQRREQRRQRVQPPHPMRQLRARTGGRAGVARQGLADEGHGAAFTSDLCAAPR